MNRSESIDKAREFLEKNLDARISDDPEWRASIMKPFVPSSIGDLETMVDKTVVVPCVRITLHPAQYERLLGMLSYIVDPEQRESLGYRTPQEMQAYDVLMEKTREKHLRNIHPTVRAAYDQYMTAIRLCT